MQRKRAQHVLEFLLTFGWIIFLSLIFLGLATYFILNKEEVIVQEECLGTDDIPCVVSQTYFSTGERYGAIRYTMYNGLSEGIVLSDAPRDSSFWQTPTICEPPVLDDAKHPYLVYNFQGIDDEGNFTQWGSSMNETTYEIAPGEEFDVVVLCETNSIQQGDVIDTSLYFHYTPVSKSFPRTTTVYTTAIETERIFPHTPSWVIQYSSDTRIDDPIPVNET